MHFMAYKLNDFHSKRIKTAKKFGHAIFPVNFIFRVRDRSRTRLEMAVRF